MILRRLLIIAFFILAIVRPTVPVELVERSAANSNVWFAIDDPRFMDDVKDIVKATPGAKYSVLAADYSAYTVVPLTEDADSVINAGASMVSVENELERASLDQLVNFAKERIDSYYNKDVNNVLVVFTDRDESLNDANKKDQIIKTILSGEAKSSSKQELYFVFALILLLLLLWEGEDLLYRILLEKEEDHA